MTTPPRPEPTVVADANVLRANDQRNILMTLATERIIDLRWTDRIEAEWVASLERRLVAKSLRDERAAVRPDFARTAKRMRDALPSFAVSGLEDFIDRVSGTEVGDRHVAAAAAACAPSVLLTWNLKDFDVEELRGLGVALFDPDRFLCDLFDGRADVVAAAVETAYGYVRQGHERRGRTSPSWDDYLELLARRGAPNALPRFAQRLQAGPGRR